MQYTYLISSSSFSCKTYTFNQYRTLASHAKKNVEKIKFWINLSFVYVLRMFLKCWPFSGFNVLLKKVLIKKRLYNDRSEIIVFYVISFYFIVFVVLLFHLLLVCQNPLKNTKQNPQTSLGNTKSISFKLTLLL